VINRLEIIEIIEYTKRESLGKIKCWHDFST
jgi:hypothetical protein